jgi:hypothetical protein
MDEPILTEFSKGFTDNLLYFCQAPEPEPAFVSGLERKLLDRQAALLPSLQNVGSISKLWKRFSNSIRIRKWQYAALLFGVALIIAIAAIGPQRVLAQVERWLGYVPGIGFVDLDQARILVMPVSIEREGVTLKIEQVVAGPDRTIVVFSSQGLPADKNAPLSSVVEVLPKAILRLPDGSVFELTRQELNYGRGKMEFPALPASVYKINFEFDRLPLVPPGAAPEGWQVPLVLLPATGKLPAELFPKPYSPTDASTTVNGVTVRILQVAQTSDETALRLQVEWDDPDWVYRGVIPFLEIGDDLGNVYRQMTSDTQVASVVAQEVKAVASPAATEEITVHNSEDTFQFPSFSLAAREAVLRLPAIDFSIPNGPSFTFDPGPDPHLGHTWELNEQLEVAGVPLNIIGARLIQDDQTYPGDPPLYCFEFAINSPTGLSREITAFYLQTDLDTYRGGGGVTVGPGNFMDTMLYTQPPQQPLTITVDGVYITMNGPWEIPWQIPGSGEAAPQIYQFKPEYVSATHAGVTLRLESALFNDKVGVVNLTAPGLPDGSRLLQVLAFDPATFDLANLSSFSNSQLYLETMQGQRVELARDVSWQPDGEAVDDPGTLVFDALPPLAERIILHIPAVELFLPGQAAFEIAVPEGLTFHSEEFSVPDLGQNNVQQVTTQTRWMSDPWEVDITLEVAGYPLHFTQAQVEQALNSNPAYRLTLTSEPLNRELDGKSLSTLHISTLTRQDGQAKSIDTVNELMSVNGLYYDRLLTENYDPARWNAKLILDVTDPTGLDILSGTYRVEIDGAIVWVVGPWDLSWSLADN